MITLTLDDPEVRGLVEARDWGILLDDYLPDRDACLSLEVLARLYAGREPYHVDGMPLEWLSRFFRQTCGSLDPAWESTMSLEDYPGRLPHASYDLAREGGMARYRKVILVDAYFQMEPHTEGVIPPRDIQNALMHAWDLVHGSRGGHNSCFPANALLEHARRYLNAELARARRDLKRRVLSLPVFEDVRIERRGVVPHEVMLKEEAIAAVESRLFYPGGLRPGLQFSHHFDRLHDRDIYFQTLTAPQLIVMDQEIFAAMEASVETTNG